MLLLTEVCNKLLHNSFENDDNLKFKNHCKSPGYSSFSGSEDLCEDPIQNHGILPHAFCIEYLSHVAVAFTDVPHDFSYISCITFWMGKVFQKQSALSTLSVVTVILPQWDC